MNLTPKEWLIAQLIATGMRDRQIGTVMGLTENSVGNYLQIVYEKIGIHSRLKLALWYVAHRGAPQS